MSCKVMGNKTLRKVIPLGNRTQATRRPLFSCIRPTPAEYFLKVKPQSTMYFGPLILQFHSTLKGSRRLFHKNQHAKRRNWYFVNKTWKILPPHKVLLFCFIKYIAYQNGFGWKSAKDYVLKRTVRWCHSYPRPKVPKPKLPFPITMIWNKSWSGKQSIC